MDKLPKDIFHYIFESIKRAPRYRRVSHRWNRLLKDEHFINKWHIHHRIPEVEIGTDYYKYLTGPWKNTYRHKFGEMWYYVTDQYILMHKGDICMPIEIINSRVVNTKKEITELIRSGVIELTTKSKIILIKGPRRETCYDFNLNGYIQKASAREEARTVKKNTIWNIKRLLKILKDKGQLVNGN